MNPELVPALEEFSHLPRFPDGRIDFSNSPKAPVLVCIVLSSDKFLIVKRSNKVSNYQGKWNGITGFLDEPRPLREKVLEELKEEIRISEKDVVDIKCGEPYNLVDRAKQKTWVVYPSLVKLVHPINVKLNWEHSDHAWITLEQLKDYDTVNGFDATVRKVFEV